MGVYFKFIYLLQAHGKCGRFKISVRRRVYGPDCFDFGSYSQGNSVQTLFRVGMYVTTFTCKIIVPHINSTSDNARAPRDERTRSGPGRTLHRETIWTAPSLGGYT